MNEGADILMVKPGLAYLDIVKSTKTKVTLLVLLYLYLRTRTAKAKKLIQHQTLNGGCFSLSTTRNCQLLVQG